MVSSYKNTKKIIVLSVIALAVFGGGSGLFIWQRNRNNTQKTFDPTISLAPATKEEKQESEASKDKIASTITKNQTEDGQNTNSGTAKKDGTVTITYAGQYGDNVEVGAFVANVFEDGGTCKLTITKDSQSITRTSTGFKDVSSTTCTPFSVPRSGLSAGTWKTKVSYSSSAVSGESSEKTIEVK